MSGLGQKRTHAPQQKVSYSITSSAVASSNIGTLFYRKPPREIQKPDHIGDSPRVKTAKSAVHAKMITAQLSTTPRVFPTMAFPTAL